MLAKNYIQFVGKTGKVAMKIFFSVGEPSGDLHGANLIRQLQAQRTDVECVGYGGPLMADAGCHLHADLTELAVMLFLRVLANLPRFWNLASQADRYFRHHRPDAVVLIDYPGFNWWIARRAKAHGIPVFYYGVPQMWAWGGWRVNKLRRLVDHALVKLPFEQQWFRDRGCHAQYVGHPFFDQLRTQQLDEAFLAEQQRQPGRLVTILPGSRTQEVINNLHVFLKAAEIVRQQQPDTRFAIAAFKPAHATLAAEELEKANIPAEIHVGRTQELMELATCCMACSGSVSLELLYYTKPTVIHYRISRIIYFAGQFLVKVPYITLVNLLVADDIAPPNPQPYDPDSPDAEKALFPEYPTCEDKSAQIATHVVEWLSSESQRQRLIARLARLKAELNHGGASQKAAEYILSAVAQRSPPAPRPHFAPVVSPRSSPPEAIRRVVVKLPRQIAASCGSGGITIATNGVIG